VDERVRARLSFVAGDMFADVPAADTYVVKTVMHDRDGASCVRMLKNCRARRAEGGRILGVDNVLPPMGDAGASGTKLLDMLMMLSLPGKERTEAGGTRSTPRPASGWGRSRRSTRAPSRASSKRFPHDHAGPRSVSEGVGCGASGRGRVTRGR